MVELADDVAVIATRGSLTGPAAILASECEAHLGPSAGRSCVGYRRPWECVLPAGSRQQDPWREGAEGDGVEVASRWRREI